MKRELLFITGNPNKLREAKELLVGYEVQSKDVDLPELQEVNEQLIVEDKIRHALKLLDSEVFVEDTSLCFDAFNGLPGPLVKWFMKTVGRRGLVDMLSGFENKAASAKCYIGYGIPARDGAEEKILVFEGVVKGRIVDSTGDSDFGWDPIFLPDGHDKTFAQMSAEEKNSISHRKLAFENFRNYLEKKK
ncbi:RdgB/HAM1 family non-canonical purine NTP pyrophosphatase [Nanoarchaeota archaeon]